MRHRKLHAKLNRTSSHRKAMLSNMVASLIEHEKIVTTRSKAKAARSLAERMITLGKEGSVHSRRRAFRVIRNKEMVHKLFEEIAGRYDSRDGGYTRIIQLGNRVGDAAPMAILELVDRPIKKAKKKKKES